MSGAELALAVVPLVIVLAEHHKAVLRKGKALAFPRSKNEQQLEFYHDLHDELCLLKVTLDRVRRRSALDGYNEKQEEAIKRVLGTSAPHFTKILDRILRSINDLVSDKSIALTQGDVVSASISSHGPELIIHRTYIIQQQCYQSSASSSKHSMMEQPQAHFVTAFNSQRMRRVAQLQCTKSRVVQRS